MSQFLFNRSPRAMSSRFAAFLSFAAVLSALLAPVGLLAEEVRTGKLGGLCGISSSQASGKVGDASNGASAMAGHCDLCGSPTLAPPSWLDTDLHAFPGSHQLAGVGRSAALSAAVSGLPPSRGPPAFL